ncbi:hypothetical protein M758_6G179300 [Ceratodon purpureus]|nr:hypothetical protein M758_6G179300 [Ceratodon purpureus]
MFLTLSASHTKLAWCMTSHILDLVTASELCLFFAHVCGQQKSNAASKAGQSP